MNKPPTSAADPNPFPPNPYVIGAPLTGKLGFYGRGETFAAVENALEAAQQNVIVLFGQRRVGKTSLLHQIARRVRDRLPVVPVYFDLQGKSGLALDEVLHQLARVIARALKSAAPPQDIPKLQVWFRESFLPGLTEPLQGRRLLLLFDEFDVLGDDQQSSEDASSHTLFPFLNELIHHESQLVFLFVVGRRIEELTTRYLSIFKQAMYQRIGLLRSEEARELIALPAQGVLDYSDAALAAILALTAGHPYLTQLIGYEVYNQAKATQTRNITPDLVRSRIDAAMESGHGALNWFWDGLPRAERFIMSALAHVAEEDGIAHQDAIRQILEGRRIVLTGLELKDAPDRLVDWDILERLPDSPDGFRFKIELLRLWIRKQHPLDSVRRDVDYISQRAVRLYENGREAQEQNNLEDARADYRSALKVNPNHSGAQLGLAQVEYELGNLDAAITEYEKAYRIDEVSARDGLVRALLERGNKVLSEGQDEDALRDFNAALKLAPNHEEARYLVSAITLSRADRDMAKGDLEAAYKLYAEALRLNPVNATVQHVYVGLERLMMENATNGDPSGAIAVMTALQELTADISLTTYSNQLAIICTKLGEALQSKGHEAEALQAYKMSLKLAPNDSEGIVNPIYRVLEHLIFDKLTAGKTSLAFTLMSALQELMANSSLPVHTLPQTWTRFGETLLNNGYKDEALQAFQKALELAPEDAYAHTLFDKLESLKAKERELDRLFNDAVSAQSSSDWSVAEQNCIELIKRDCLEWQKTDIPEMLVAIRQKMLNYQHKYILGKQAYDLGDWSKAINHWQTLDQKKLGELLPELPLLMDYAQSEFAKSLLSDNAIAKDKETASIITNSEPSFFGKIIIFVGKFIVFLLRLCLATVLVLCIILTLISIFGKL